MIAVVRAANHYKQTRNDMFSNKTKRPPIRIDPPASPPRVFRCSGTLKRMLPIRAATLKRSEAPWGIVFDFNFFHIRSGPQGPDASVELRFGTCGAPPAARGARRTTFQPLLFKVEKAPELELHVLHKIRP